MSAKPRSLLKLDQAYIAVGGREHLTLGRETDIMRVIALRISPRDAGVPSSTHLPTRCRVPTSAHDLPRQSPVGTKPDAHRIGSRAPLGLALRAAELQVCIPMVCPIPQTAGRPLPAYPFPLAGRLSVSLHTLVHGRLTVGVKRHSDSTDALSVKFVLWGIGSKGEPSRAPPWG